MIEKSLGWVSWKEDDTPKDILAFNRFGKSSISWYEQSKGLHFAAETLWKQASNKQSRHARSFDRPIALMLAGLAVETLLKMAIVHEYCEVHGFPGHSTKTKEFLPPSHKLGELAVISRLRLNKTDRTTLDKLSNYVVWAGRYPVPLFADGYSSPAFLEHIPVADFGGQPGLWGEYDALYRKLHRLSIRKVFKDQFIRSH